MANETEERKRVDKETEAEIDVEEQNAVREIFDRFDLTRFFSNPIWAKTCDTICLITYRQKE